MAERGEFFETPLARFATATVHPSAILRAPEPAQRQEAFEAFVRDLKAVRRMMDRAT